jgi:hypothetical protein
VPDPARVRAAAAWKSLMAAVGKSGDRVERAFNLRRSTARRERVSPPPMIRKVNFCIAPETNGRFPSVRE